MAHERVLIDCARITDWESFHSEFATAFGFPDFYGRNMAAWVDCLSSLDAPEDGMTSRRVTPGGVVALELPHARDLAIRCPEIYAALVECSAFVNYRRLEVGEPPLLCLSFHH